MRKWIIILLFFPLLSACEKLMFEENKQSTDPYDNFDYLWKECDEKYSFFKYKNINWEQIRDEYRSKLYTEMSDDSLFKVMGAMMSKLRDDHANLISDFNVSFYGVHKKGPDNFDGRILEDHYLPENYYNSGPFQHAFISGDSIAYVRLAAFPGSVDDKNLDFIINRYKNTKGIIFDIRENGGGRISDIYNIMSRFVDNKTLIYYSRLKNGPGYDDFSESKPVYLEPSEPSYLKKVMVLTDRGTYSAGSFTALATKAVPNMTLIGDTTGGGLGLPNGGQLPNGWTYRFSVTQTLDLDYQNHETGVPPDITVYFDWSDRSNDEIIERAIEEINK